MSKPIAPGEYATQMRRLQERLAGTHEYLSTACAHELHEECRRTCKFCATHCICVCHPHMKMYASR